MSVYVCFILQLVSIKPNSLFDFDIQLVGYKGKWLFRS